MIEIDFDGTGAFGTGRYTVYVSEGKEMAAMMKSDDLDEVLEYKQRIRSSRRKRPPQVQIYDRILNSFDLKVITHSFRHEKRLEEEARHKASGNNR